MLVVQYNVKIAVPDSQCPLDLTDEVKLKIGEALSDKYVKNMVANSIDVYADEIAVDASYDSSENI